MAKTENDVANERRKRASKLRSERKAEIKRLGLKGKNVKRVTVK